MVLIIIVLCFAQPYVYIILLTFNPILNRLKNSSHQLGLN